MYLWGTRSLPEIYNPTCECEKAASTLSNAFKPSYQIVSKVGILEFFVMFLFLEFIGTLLSMCLRTEDGCRACEVSGAVGSPCRLAHLDLWSSEAEKSKTMCWGKGTMVPCTVVPGVYDKYTNCIITFKSQNRSRLNGTSADNAKKKPAYHLKSLHTAVCLAHRDDSGKPALE